jgi:hypothetical protein
VLTGLDANLHYDVISRQQKTFGTAGLPSTHQNPPTGIPAHQPGETQMDIEAAV